MQRYPAPSLLHAQRRQLRRSTLSLCRTPGQSGHSQPHALERSAARDPPTPQAAKVLHCTRPALRHMAFHESCSRDRIYAMERSW